MFTQFKKGRWNYMFMAAIASIAVAALATLFTTRSTGTTQSRANHDNEQVVSGKYTQYNESTVRFIN